MATLCSCASGNWTSASTWAVVDATSFSATETNSQLVTTSYLLSVAFTPGAIEIDAIGFKLANRALSPTGTLSLALHQGGVLVAGTEVTIDVADLPAADATRNDGGWMCLKLASPVTLSAATAYTLGLKTSAASQVNAWRATTSNWARFLRTTTTQAPAAGDDMIVAGELTGQGTGNDIAVTMDETAATDYGSAPIAGTSLVTPGLSVNLRGTLTWGVSAATNYLLRMSNSVMVFLGGTWSQGTTGAPTPRDSTAFLEFDTPADGQYGFLARGGTVNIQGLSRSSGKDIVWCKLNTDEAIASTSLGVDTDTGWLDNDVIAIASTTRTAGQHERGALNGAAGASSLAVDGFAGAGGGLAFAHSGTAPAQAHIVLLTRNVGIRSASSANMAYVFLGGAVTADIDWAEFYYLGVNSGTKRGVEIALSTGSVDIQYCSFHDTEVNGVYLDGISGAGSFVFSHNVGHSLSTTTGPAIRLSSASGSAAVTLDDNVLVRCGNNDLLFVGFGTLTLTNFVAANGANNGVNFQGNYQITGTISGLEAYGFSASGLVNQSNTPLTGTISDIKSWRNTLSGIALSGTAGLVIDGAELFGNAQSINTPAATQFRLIDGVSNGDSSFATTNGLVIAANSGVSAILENCDFSTASGIKTAHTNDISISNARTECAVRLRNCALGAATEISSTSNLVATPDIAGWVSSQDHDQSAGSHRLTMNGGVLSTDATIYRTAAPSMRMAPVSGGERLPSSPPGRGMQVAVASGATATVSVYVRKSEAGDGAAYNGAEPRLYVRANSSVGIILDTLLDTASGAAGSWEQLSGTTASATVDGVVEVFVDCGVATTGWVNVDDWAVS